MNENGLVVLCDLDDYPLGHWKRCIQWLDELHTVNPNFRCTVFSVPAAMEEKHWKPLIRRRRWLRVGWHGFIHGHLECTLDIDYGRLFDLFADKRFAPIFKGGWLSPGKRCIEAVRDRNWVYVASSRRALLGVKGLRAVFKRMPNAEVLYFHSHDGWHRKYKLAWDMPDYLEWVRGRQFKFAEELAC